MFFNLLLHLLLFVLAGLAFQIIRYYPDLVFSVNENGLTPLHILASKPHVFKSGSGLGWLESFVYKCKHIFKESESRADIFYPFLLIIFCHACIYSSVSLRFSYSNFYCYSKIDQFWL